MTATPANNFKTAFNMLGLELTTKTNFDAYYVERPESPIEELKTRIEMDTTPSKFFFTGLRATGKTTELRRLMFMLNGSHYIVYFSVLDVLDLSDVTYVDVMLAMGLKTLNTIEENNIQIDKKIMKDLYLLFAEITGQQVSEEIIEETTETGYGAKLTLLVTEVLGKYKSETVTRVAIRQKVETKIQDYLERFNALIIEIQNNVVKKPLLIIVDDLEKLDLQRAEDICHKHCATLARPICKVLFTVPVSLVFAQCWKQVEMTLGSTRYFLPLISPVKKSGEIDEEGLSFLRSVVLKRVSEQHFEPQVLNLIVNWSGGVVVDLLNMVRDCCVKAQSRKLQKITSELAMESFSSLTDSYKRPLQDKYYATLREIHSTKTVKNTDDLRDLLYLCVVLEYDGVHWYDVHPAIARILSEQTAPTG